MIRRFSRKTWLRYLRSTVWTFLLVFAPTFALQAAFGASLPPLSLRPQFGIIACLLLLFPKDERPLVLVAAYIGSLLSSTGITPLIPPVFAACPVLEAWTLAALLEKTCGRMVMDDVRHIAALVFLSAAVSSAVAALGALAASATALWPFFETARIWAVSDGLGVVLLVPFGIAVEAFARRTERVRRIRILEGSALVAAAAALGSLWFLPLSPSVEFAFFVLTAHLPFLFWAGARLGVLGTSAASLVLFSCATIGTALGRGVFSFLPIPRGEAIVLASAYSMWFSLVPLFNAATTDRRERTERALAASERRLKLIVHWIADIVVILDQELRIRSISPAFDRLTGLASAGLAGKAITELIEAEDGPAIAAALRGLAAEGGEAPALAARLRKSDGSILVAEITATALLNDPAISGILVTMHDLTEQSRAKEEAERARKAAEKALGVKSDFLSNMSHEIRTPLTGMLGMTSLLSRTALDEGQRSYVDRLEASGRLLLAIVNDILDLEKVDSGAKRPRAAITDIAALCRDAIGSFEAVAAAKALVLESSFSGLDRRLRTDPQMLSQILSNLLGNAVKFTEKGAVRLEASAAERAHGMADLRISVSDTGVGIPLSARDLVFERFSQVDSSYSKAQKGTGLGLHIVKRYVALLGGTIELRSEVGRGSTFAVSLGCAIEGPAGSDPRPEANAPRGAEESGGAASVVRRSALVVEDNGINLFYIEDLLSSAGYAVRTAADGYQALAALEVQVPDIVLLDVQMPGMDGIECSRRIRASPDPHLRSVPIVALTGYAMEADGERCLGAGMDRVVIKPFDDEDLLEAMRRPYPGRS